MSEIEQLVRTRLRSLRHAQSLSLEDLAERSHLSPSTISRIETGKRAISLDVLLPLARALRTDVETLLEDDADDDVVIRPEPSRESSRTTWMLSKATGTMKALKVRLEAASEVPEQRVHPGHDWFFVMEGRVRLLLGERAVIVEAGEAAEFGTMTPHAFVAEGGPAEVIMIFDQEGHAVHRHDGED
ncbi:helix-turn-helix transcriptional regulator [Kocuria sp. cx-455]|uniref:helix-turn-helix domain-containing protein n=1 Tax=Kocuria sp. cx-455 TaxID=2771377 RepID=UPI001685C269|nr:XRE family transcriptional regulator [Kocuria sp. cx-455]MBD2764464.1 helix-turn-helix transcriptional regulator [Kocuria sp. cx-455]